jgi:acetyltransferase-like isoleucine patch superfamily enzyme
VPSDHALAYRVNGWFTRTSARATTRFYRVRYYFALAGVGPHAAIGRRFRIKPITVFSDRLLKVTLGHHVNFEPGVTIQGQGHVEIGDWSTVGSNTTIGCSDRVTIGVAALIASGVSIRDTNHRFDDTEQYMSSQGITSSPITIEDDVWIGANAVITEGVTIGRGSIIGANAVVTRDVEPWSIMGGVPARLIRKRR